MRSLQLTMVGAIGLVAALNLCNASQLAPWRGRPRVLAHRGVHQTFSADGVDAATCTAARVTPPEHGYLENTLPAVQAAFDAGAGAVEIDVRGTADGHLVVLHDATLDCRTDGHGVPEEHSLAELRALDLGYGYTADGGATYPLRGSGAGLLVTLEEVFAHFPGRAFVIDVKSGRAEDGERVADVLAALPEEDRRLQIVYGAPVAVARVSARLPEVRTLDRARVKRCVAGYAATGWLGHVPEACAHTLVLVPVDLAPLLWGYPRRLEARLARVGSELALMGPLQDGVTTGIDGAELLAEVPADFGGWVWTNRAEVVGPLLHGR
ncbi:MAG: glycerophosphodiester phosphodiesterase family protein [Pseudomonadota bacterium]